MLPLNEVSCPHDSTVLRRRLSFGLAVAGLLTTVLASLELWLPWHRQTTAIAEVRRLGGTVANTEPVGPEWLREFVGPDVMAGYDEIEVVRLWNTTLTDDDLAKISALTDLKTLSLTNTDISDAGLVYVARLSGLNYLDLNETQLTGIGLVHLHGLTELEVLSLRDTHVTDESLQHLSSLTKLRSLSLGNSKITDAGLVHLDRATFIL